ncbi:hypothetical protein ACIBL3_17790 [Kribbella sp. NPDC050124]|uniref:hypothetical protein n=1 Tax=Kribbella sp. NPDC050124 TaxID=3364114 RepID=UPI003798C357
MDADLRRSGFVDWDHTSGTGQDLELLLIPLLWIVNWLTNLVVFQGGWTLRIYRVEGDDRVLVQKTRYRRKAAALVAMARIHQAGKSVQGP